MFDIHQQLKDDQGKRDERRYGEYLDTLLQTFAESPEGRACCESHGRLAYVYPFLDYYFGHIGNRLSAISVGDVHEVVFELFPRKLSTDPESAPEIVMELRAFWAFLGREFQMPQAAAIQALLDDAAILDLKNLLADPSTYGTAKSFVMMGRAAGFDMTSIEDAQKFMALYNATLLEARSAG